MTIDTEAGSAVVSTNDRGDVAAAADVTRDGGRYIIVWDTANRPHIQRPPADEKPGSFGRPFTTDAVVAPDGTLYGTAGYPFSGAFSGVRTRLYAWQNGDARAVATACPGSATDLHPTAVAVDGRVALAGSYDSAVLNFDAINLGRMPPTANILNGTTCDGLDAGWISALDGRFAAGHRGYQDGKLIPPNVNAQSQQYVAVRWHNAHAEELGPGAALGVNAHGDCVGSDAPPGIHQRFTMQTGPGGMLTQTPLTEDLHAMMWRMGSRPIRLSRSARRSVAYGINESGHTIVGTLYDAQGQHAVRWRNGNAELLDRFLPSGSRWHLLVAYGVTANGAIYGVGRRNGALAAFVMGVSDRGS